MERDRQRELRPERGEPPDTGHDARGRDRDVARTQAEPASVVERLDGGQHPVEVEQRLAHAHEHDVGEPLPGRDQPARRRTDLVDDLGHLEVAPEAELTGCAERAADRAAGLARDAQRVALARSGPRRIVHQNGLDEGPVGQTVERLLGQPAVRPAHLGLGDGVEAEGHVERLAQRGRQGPDVGRAPRVTAPHRVADLAGSIRRLPALAEPGVQLLRREARDPGPLVEGHESDASARVPTIPGCPRRNASQVMRSPPAGCTSMSDRRSRSPTPRPRSSNTPLGAPPDAPGLADQHGDPPERRVDERAGPRLIGPDLALELRGRPAGVQPAVLAGQPPGQGRAVRRLSLWADLAAQPGPEVVRQQVGRDRRPAAPRGPAPFRVRSAGVAVERRSGPCRVPRPCASG